MTSGSEFPHFDIVTSIADGSGPKPYLIRDQERHNESLESCLLPSVVRERLTPVRLELYAATIWLPSPETARVTEVPDTTWKGWEWSSGDSMLVSAYHVSELPGLWELEIPDASSCRVTIGERPMLVTHHDRMDSSGPRFRAEIRGFLDDATRFWAMVEGLTPQRRDDMLAALCTIEVDRSDDAGIVARPQIAS